MLILLHTHTNIFSIQFHAKKKKNVFTFTKSILNETFQIRIIISRVNTVLMKMVEIMTIIHVRGIQVSIQKTEQT